MTDANAADTLLVDLGNTALRWCRVSSRGLSDVTYLARGSADIERNLTELWDDMLPPAAVWISSVAAAGVADRLARWVNQRWRVTARFVTAESRAFGIVNGYRQPEQLGVDRWLALIGARQICPTDLCVVDAGTALTLDLLRADGRHLGGYIVPGLGSMRRSLLAGTQIPRVVDAECPDRPASDTACAVARGSRLALSGLIEGSVAVQESETGTEVKLILTGSEAQPLSRCLSVAHEIRPDLVLTGLARYATQPEH